MTSLDLAHGMGYVWVVRLSDDHVGQLDPPENDTDVFIYQDAHDDVDAVDSADEEEWSQSPVVVSEMIHHPPSVITPGLAACMSPRLRQKLEAQARKRSHPPDDPIKNIEPFAFFGVKQADRKRTKVDAAPRSIGLPRPIDVIVRNAARLTLACQALGLDETSPILSDEQVQRCLNDRARRPYQRRFGETILEVHPDTVDSELALILCNSDHLVRRTLARLVMWDEPAWKVSLCLEKEAQRELVCGAMFEPRGLDSAFADPVRRYYLAWSDDIQPVLDRLDGIITDIYGEASSGAVIERLYREQAEGIRSEGRSKTPLLGRLVDMCKMWNDTIAGYKVQKLLFADGLERC